MGRKDEIIERVRNVAEPLAAQEGLELVDVQIGGSGRTELTLFIDRLPGGAPGELHANMPAASDVNPRDLAPGHHEHNDDSATTSVHAPVILPIDDADTVEGKPLEFYQHGSHTEHIEEDEPQELGAADEIREDDGDEFEGGEPGSGEAYLEVQNPKGMKPGVTLDDCANFSRIVSAALDVEDPLDGAYELVVSSPGLDRPLRTPEHYEKYKGKRARIKTYAPVPEAGNRKTYVGILLGYDNAKNAVLIDVDGTHFSVPRQSISKANLDPVFDL